MILKKLRIIVVFLITSFMISSCFIGAGTHGKITEYELNFSTECVLEYMNLIVQENKFSIPKDSLYSLKGTGYEDDYHFLQLEYGNVKYVFEYSIRSKNDFKTKIVLVSAAKYGEVIVFADKLKEKEKVFYRELFEECVVSAVVIRATDNCK